jgi:hypothetical protein
MIYIVLLSILYVALGYLFSEAVWSAPELKKAMAELAATTPEELLVFPFVLARFVTALFWPFLFVWGIVSFVSNRVKGKAG